MPSRPSGLGRGLGSLIPNKKPAPTGMAGGVYDSSLSDITNADERIMQLPVEKILPSPHQPRQTFKAETLSDLAESIKEHGLIQPLIVCRLSSGDYELIAGERRLRAAKIIGLLTVSAIVRDFKEQKKMELALIENLQREDLNALEVAAAYKKLEDEFNLTRKQLAHKVGKSEQSVTNTMRLLNLRDEVKQAIIDGRLTEGHARALAGLPPDDQLEGMNNILKKRMTVREAEFATQEVVARKHLRPTKFDPEAKDMENQLAAALGTKVEVRRRGGAGQITIKFFSNEELREIFKKII